MNITLLANRDLGSNHALNLLVPLLLDGQHRLRIFLSSHIGSGGALPEELAGLEFFEQHLFNDILFPALREGAPGAEALSFDALGERVGHAVEILNRINTSKGRARLAATEPELVLSIRYGAILRPKAIAVPRHGVLNLHSGVLPRYRGVMPTFRALMAGATELGTTLHTIEDASIDTGEVVGETRRPVEPGRSYLWQVLGLYADGCALMAQAADRIARGETLETRPQVGGGAYYTFPTEAELRAFRELGHRLFAYDEAVELARRFLPPTASASAGES